MSIRPQKQASAKADPSTFGSNVLHGITVIARLNKTQQDTYYLYNTALVFSDHCKYLGVTLQSNLRWDKHINEKITIASCIPLGLLRIIRTPQHISEILLIKLQKLEYLNMHPYSVLTLAKSSHWHY